jgi:hypothetical protein
MELYGKRCGFHTAEPSGEGRRFLSTIPISPFRSIRASHAGRLVTRLVRARPWFDSDADSFEFKNLRDLSLEDFTRKEGIEGCLLIMSDRSNHREENHDDLQ